MPFTNLSKLWKKFGPKVFCWAKLACFDFSSSNFNFQGHILSTGGVALRSLRFYASWRTHLVYKFILVLGSLSIGFCFLEFYLNKLRSLSIQVLFWGAVNLVSTAQSCLSCRSSHLFQGTTYIGMLVMCLLATIFREWDATQNLLVKDIVPHQKKDQVVTYC